MWSFYSSKRPSKYWVVLPLSSPGLRHSAAVVGHLGVVSLFMWASSSKRIAWASSHCGFSIPSHNWEQAPMCRCYSSLFLSCVFECPLCQSSLVAKSRFKGWRNWYNFLIRGTAKNLWPFFWQSRAVCFWPNVFTFLQEKFARPHSRIPRSLISLWLSASKSQGLSMICIIFGYRWRCSDTALEMWIHLILRQ